MRYLGVGLLLIAGLTGAVGAQEVLLPAPKQAEGAKAAGTIRGQSTAAPLGAQAIITERLPAAEYSAGWLKLFDGETTFGWTVSGEGAWKVEEGAVVSPDAGTTILSSNTTFADYDLTFEMQSDNGVHIFFKDGCNDEDGKLKLTNGDLGLWGPNDEKPTWHTYTLHIVGDKVDSKRDTHKGRDFKRVNLRSAVVFGIDHPAGVTGVVKLRNIKLKPLNLAPAFNGKNLTGWKVLPGHASVFSVTPEGWMNVKNGNGEIQTEKEWGDFTYQMDIYSNGDHLNSGIFFREKADNFWNGYECQIRNQWQGDDRKKPVDTGTGGLYFRQPARKVVSSDREWFTMSINAVGRHIAIWVDGYQTCDFLDTRPEGDGMARDNARIKPGVFGLQGHDPTTDLSFRNIKVSEMPPATK